MSMRPRDYQSLAIASTLSAFQHYQRLLGIAATGTGKTVIFAMVIRHFLETTDKRVMVLAHRDELIRQAADKIERVTGIRPAIEKANERTDERIKPRVVVSSVQTQNSGTPKRMTKFDPNEFGLIITDESHRATGKQFHTAISHYLQNPECKLLGVTATPDRTDGEPLGNIFEHVAFRYDLFDAIRDGYLVRPIQHRVYIEGLDFSNIGTVAGDFNQAELEALMLTEGPLHGVVHATIEEATGVPEGTLTGLLNDPNRTESLSRLIGDNRRLQTKVFAVSVNHARKMAEIFNRWIPDSAAHVAGPGRTEDGFMDMQTRRERLSMFHERRIQFLISVMTLTEGWDEDRVELLSCGRVTKSRLLACQMVGRCTRPLEDVARVLDLCASREERLALIANSDKPSCRVLDYVGNSGRHKLACPVDVLGDGRFDPDVIERANEIVGEGDIQEALELAEVQIEAEREANRILAEMNAQSMDDTDDRQRIERERDHAERVEAAKRKHLVATSQYSLVEVSDDVYDIPAPHIPEFRSGPDPKTIESLVKMGVNRDKARKFGAKQATIVLRSMRQRSCSEGQAIFLRKLRVASSEIASMNFYQAQERINELRVTQ